MTRIVAGRAGGRRLKVPPRGTRPTSERVREAVFSAVQARIELDGSSVLDLYAGTGALGLEALSRGAERVLFVESDRRAAAVLRANIAALDLPGAQVCVDAVAAVLRAGPPLACRLVLADPPYDLPDAELAETLHTLAGGWLAPGGLVVLERSVRSAPPVWPDGVAPLTERRYGDTVVHYGHGL